MADLVTPPPLRLDASGREQRIVLARPELRAESRTDGTIGFRGHAAVFNSRSVVLSDWWDTFQEEIEPNAFADVLEQDVRFLINHDDSQVLARTVAGNLRLSEDEVGLLAEADMAPTTYARDLEVSMRAGNISQMSFSFVVAPDGERWDIGDDGMLIRTITRVARLYDVSAVTYPAYLETDAALRSALRKRSERGQRPASPCARCAQRDVEDRTQPTDTPTPLEAPPQEEQRRHDQALRHQAMAAQFRAGQ